MQREKASSCCSTAGQNPKLSKGMETGNTDRTLQLFLHAGILSAYGVTISENEDDIKVEAATAAADDDDLLLSQWVRKIDCDILGDFDYDMYAITDDTVKTKTQTDKEDEEEGKPEVPIPTE
jgi:hypothetical protein